MSFATVVYADGKEALLNINCKNINFLEYARFKCGEVCDITDQLDVADESGECKFLFKNPESYTSQFVAERDKLILLRVEEPKPGEKLANNCRFVPLLKNLEDDKEFIFAINPTVGNKSMKPKIATKLSVKKAMNSGNSNSPYPGSPAGSTGAGGKRQSISSDRRNSIFH